MSFRVLLQLFNPGTFPDDLILLGDGDAYLRHELHQIDFSYQKWLNTITKWAGHLTQVHIMAGKTPVFVFMKELSIFVDESEIGANMIIIPRFILFHL